DTVCDVPADISEVDEVLEFLAALRRPRSEAPPLAEFVVRLQKQRRDLEIPTGWFSDQGLDKAAVEALRTSVDAQAEVHRKLVIDLCGSGPGKWQTAVTGYLGPRWCMQTVECEPGVDGVRSAVVKIVEWARSNAVHLAIGLLLGHDLLRELPEQWMYEGVGIPPVRLCEEFPVVLHAAERMIDQFQAPWRSKLTTIEASSGAPPRVLWLDRDDAAAIRRAVRASNHAYVAFTFVPEART